MAVEAGGKVCLLRQEVRWCGSGNVGVKAGGVLVWAWKCWS